LVVEEVIHVRFDKTKPDKYLSELDESFPNIVLDDNLIETSSSTQNSEIEACTQEEEKETSG